MATAQSSYSSTEETTNANRACRLLLGPCTDQLRDVLRKEVPPPTFVAEISKQKFNLPRLNPEQRNLILPNIGSYSGNYDDFDISLLYILLRNICNINSHKTGWGNVPDVNDSCLSANIERIRFARNKTVHAARPFLTNTDFKNIWTSVRCAVVAIDSHLSNGNHYEREVDILRYTTMDPVQDKHYRDQLAKQYADDQQTKECVRELKENLGIYHKETDSKINRLEEMSNTLKNQMNICSLRRNQLENEIKDEMHQLNSACRPPNIRDQHNKTLSTWKKSVFFETSSFQNMKDFFISHQTVVVIGSPGSGKTALIRHIALQLESKYQIVPISKPEDIIIFGDVCRPQIFVIDDVLGVFSLERNLLSDLDRHSDQIESVLDKKSKLFISCRLAVFNEAKELDVKFFEENNIISLNSERNILTLEDQKGIFESHMKNAEISCTIDSKLPFEKGIPMFPLLCQMFSTDKCIREYGSEFFTYPSKCLLSELGKIRKRNKLQYASMVLVMLNNNCLSVKVFVNKGMLENICKSCKVKETHKDWEIFQQLSHLKDTYTVESNDQYTFMHDLIFEVVAYHYGQQFPDQILEYMNSSFIANRVVLENTDSGNDLCIKLKKSQYENLAKRLYIDVKRGKLHDVFINGALRNPVFRQHFKQILSRAPYEDVKTFFLSSREELFESVILDSKKEDEKTDLENKGIGQREIERQDLLLGLRCIGQSNVYEIRVISFIIYYGHLDLLRYIMDLVGRHHQNKDIIFGCTQEEQVRLLVLACFQGRLDMVKILLDYTKNTIINRMPVEEVDASNNRHRLITPVIAACMKMKHDTIKHLILNGADLNPQNSFYPALWTPSRVGDLRTVTYLLQHGADCNSSNGEGITPLHLGSQFGHLNMVKKLIEQGAYINKCDNQGRTSLHMASQNGHLPIVETLIQHDAVYDQCDIKGVTPLHLASCDGHVAVVKKLIECGADINWCINNMSSLHLASSYCHILVVEKLIEHGASINSCDAYGQTSLHFASRKGHMSIVDLLIQHGANYDQCDKINATPLHYASCYGHAQVVEKLIEHGADINKCVVIGLSPLHTASMKGHLSVVEMLIEAGADLNMCSNFNKKLLHLQFQDKKSSLSKTLQSIINISHRCNNVAPLHFASAEGHNHVVKKLIEHGADINVRTSDDWLSLHLAAEYGNLSVVETLLRSGGDFHKNYTKEKLQFNSASLTVHVPSGEQFSEDNSNINKMEKNEQTPFDLASKKDLFSVETTSKDSTDIRMCEINVRSTLHLLSEKVYSPKVGKLTQNNSNVNICNMQGQSSLHRASIRGHLSVVEKIISFGADINMCDIHGQTSLIFASYEGHLPVVEKLIQNNADINKCDIKEQSPLHFASLIGHLPLVEKLIQKNADINKCESQGQSPLHFASRRGHLPVVEELLEHGADIDKGDNQGLSSLLVASWEGHLPVVETLINHGADINLCAETGETSLHLASQDGHVAVVETLILYGAKYNQCDENKVTPLHRASEKGHDKVVKKLLDAGSDINMKDINGLSPLFYGLLNDHITLVYSLIEHGADINMCGCQGQLPLHVASLKGNFPVVKKLIKQGADINKCNIDGESSLHLASEKGHLAVVEKLLQHGADFNQQDICHSTPLHRASYWGHAHVVEKLIKHGADVNRCNINDILPLHYASENGHLSVVEILLQFCTDCPQNKKRKIENNEIPNACNRKNEHVENIDKLDKNGFSPLYLASKNGHLSIVETLICHGANCNTCDKNYVTPLHRASSTGNVTIAEKIIKSGADPNSCDKDGQSPLHDASINGHLSVVEALIRHGAKCNQCDEKKVTPIHMASFAGHVQVVERLIEAGSSINKRDINGRLPLDLALYKHHKSVINLLIEHGASISNFVVFKTQDTRKTKGIALKLLHKVGTD